MKKNIHPNWNDQAKFTCACGNTFTGGSMQDEVSLEICSKCHPFFTGEQKFVDTQGRVDKFMQKMAKAQKIKAAKKTKADKRKQAKTKKTDNKTYKQLLSEQKSKVQASEKASK